MSVKTFVNFSKLGASKLRSLEFMSSTKFSIKCGLIILINGLFSSFLLVLNFK